MKIALVISAFMAVATAAGPPAYGPAPTYPDIPPAYQYQYAVKDDYAAVNFGANEARDGYATNGEYTVALPDGRLQTVKYTVSDAYSGYVADVSYSGKPLYDSYKSAPAYKGN
ncbi:pro-resilin [Lepeophtheirus salmonis]|nr:cuticle protein 21-like [Lepeophtheirus salmonis]